MSPSLHRILASALVLSLASSAAVAQDDAVVGFDAGANGWSINGINTILPTGGNPDHRVRYPDPIDTFGIAARNNSNTAFLGNYAAKGDVTLSIDFLVDTIHFFGTPAPRELVVMLYDDDNVSGNPAQVWKSLGVLDGQGMPWSTFSADVIDATSATIPAGWNGAGWEDPMTFEPILPPGATWANVLSGIDRIEFTTFVPGFFFGFTHFDVSIDNVSITSIDPVNAWSDQGNALAGVNGDPALAGTGTFAGGSANSLDVSNAAPSALAAMFVGFTDSPAPFKGGTLVPAPALTITLGTDGAGALSLPFVMPGGVPAGAQLWIQTALQDAAAVNGVALTNAILGVTP